MPLLSDREAFDKAALEAAEGRMLRKIAQHMSLNQTRGVWEFDRDCPLPGGGLFMGAIRHCEREAKRAKVPNARARWLGVAAALKNHRSNVWAERDIQRAESLKEQ